MAERGKNKTVYSSTGSNFTVKSTPGSLYGINVMPGNGGVVLLVNGAGTLGASPNYNSDSITGLIARLGPYSTSSNGVVPNPDLIAFAGIGFDALTIAASSNTRLLVEYE